MKVKLMTITLTKAIDKLNAGVNLYIIASNGDAITIDWVVSVSVQIQFWHCGNCHNTEFVYLDEAVLILLTWIMVRQRFIVLDAPIWNEFERAYRLAENSGVDNWQTLFADVHVRKYHEALTESDYKAANFHLEYASAWAEQGLKRAYQPI